MKKIIFIIVSVFLLLTCGSMDGTNSSISDIVIAKGNEQNEDNTTFVCLCPRLGLSRHTIPRELSSNGFNAKKQWIIRHDYYYEKNSIFFPDIPYPDDIINNPNQGWSRYYGTYNGWVIVVHVSFARAVSYIVLGNKNFFFPTRSYIWAWKQDDTGKGTIHNIGNAYRLGIITDDDVQSMYTIHQAW